MDYEKGSYTLLKWADINFDSNLLNIDKSLGRIDGKAIEKSTKNESSVRTIYLDDETIDIIKQWRNFYLKEQSQLPLTKLNISDDICSLTYQVMTKLNLCMLITLITY